MKEADQQRFTELLSWAAQSGGELHPAVDIYHDDLTGFSLRVKENSSISPAADTLTPGDAVLACPLMLSLSYLNALSGGPVEPHRQGLPETNPAFPHEFLTTLPPHIIGRFYLIQQYLLGSKSFWSPYIQTLPQPQALNSWSLPPFWTEDDATFLEGTNAGVAIEEIRSNLKNEFKKARKILKEANFPGWQDYTRLLYNWSYSMFTSRSFRPSTIISDQVRESVLPSNCGIDDFSILLPVFDLANHSLLAKVQWDTRTRADACLLRCHDMYKPGDQIFNNYGKKTNSELFLAYGFVIPETDILHNDYIHLRKRRAADSTSDKAQLAGNSSTQAVDFLISLRPMAHPSSFVGRARQRVAQSPDFPIKSEFSHIEDNLVWDMSILGMTDDEKDSFVHQVVPDDTPLGLTSRVATEAESADSVLREQREQECLRRILSTSLPEELDQIESKVKEMLLAKLGYEYDKLCESHPGGQDENGQDLDIEPANRNQELALQYRAQSRKALENTIAALVPNWQDDAEL